MPIRTLYLILGYVSLALGIIGAMLPVLPTTPFAILSAYFFSRSSPKMHRWILNLPKIGNAVRDWEEKGAIRPKAKILCVLMIMVFLGSSTYFLNVVIAVKVFLVLLGLGVITFVLSRPNQ